MIIYSNRPVNSPSRRARAAERRTTFAAVMLTFSVIITLATVKRIIDRPNESGNLSDVAALAYAAIAPQDTTDTVTDGETTDNTA